MSDPFEDLDKAFGDDVYFQQGDYIVCIGEIKSIQNGHRGDTVIIKATVGNTNSVHDLHPAATKVAAQALKMDGDRRKMGQRDWVKFLCACYGVKPTDYDGAGWQAISANVIGQQQALLGSWQFVHVWEKATTSKQAKVPFYTQHDWKGPPTQEQMVAFHLDPALLSAR